MHEQQRAERDGDQVQRAEDEHQLGIGRHRSPNLPSRAGREPPVRYHRRPPWHVRSTPHSRSPPAPVEGSRSTRRLRREGLVPGVVYGGGDEPQTFAVDARILRVGARARAARSSTSPSTAATATPVIVKDVQNHPVRGEAIHVDLLRVDMNQPIHSTVVLELVGARGGARRRRGRRAQPGDARGQRRGAPGRHPRRHPARRLRDGDERDADAGRRHGARGRHAARRPRGDRHRHDHPADARAGRGRDRDRDRAGRRGRRAARGR